jgi:hypothetical protein
MHLACLKLQTGQAQTENRLSLVSVEPNVGFRSLAQITSIRAVVGNIVMIIVYYMAVPGGPLPNLVGPRLSAGPAFTTKTCSKCGLYMAL